jgi:hypothetical protein
VIIIHTSVGIFSSLNLAFEILKNWGGGTSIINEFDPVKRSKQ